MIEVVRSAEAARFLCAANVHTAVGVRAFCCFRGVYLYHSTLGDGRIDRARCELSNAASIVQKVVRTKKL